MHSYNILIGQRETRWICKKQRFLYPNSLFLSSIHHAPELSIPHPIKTASDTQIFALRPRDYYLYLSVPMGSSFVFIIIHIYAWASSYVGGIAHPPSARHVHARARLFRGPRREAAAAATRGRGYVPPRALIIR